MDPSNLADGTSGRATKDEEFFRKKQQDKEAADARKRSVLNEEQRQKLEEEERQKSAHDQQKSRHMKRSYRMSKASIDVTGLRVPARGRGGRGTRGRGRGGRGGHSAANLDDLMGAIEVAREDTDTSSSEEDTDKASPQPASASTTATPPVPPATAQDAQALASHSTTVARSETSSATQSVSPSAPHKAQPHVVEPPSVRPAAKPTSLPETAATTLTPQDSRSSSSNAPGPQLETVGAHQATAEERERKSNEGHSSADSQSTLVAAEGVNRSTGGSSAKPPPKLPANPPTKPARKQITPPRPQVSKAESGDGTKEERTLPPTRTQTRGQADTGSPRSRSSSDIQSARKPQRKLSPKNRRSLTQARHSVTLVRMPKKHPCSPEFERGKSGKSSRSARTRSRSTKEPSSIASLFPCTIH